MSEGRHNHYVYSCTSSQRSRSESIFIYDYHFYSSLKIDLEFYRVTAAHPDRCDRWEQMGIDKLHAFGTHIQSATLKFPFLSSVQ
eukprot:COSAG01_NODE_145_length_24103_cov_41.178012_25_plen_85_part_00